MLPDSKFALKRSPGICWRAITALTTLSRSTSRLYERAGMHAAGTGYHSNSTTFVDEVCADGATETLYLPLRSGFLVSEHRLCGYQECFSYRENMLVFMQSSATQRDATSVGSCCSDETPGSHRRLCLGPISRCGCSDTLAPMASTQIEQVRVAILRGLHACPADTAVACVVLLCIASRQLHQQHEDMEMLERAVVYNLDHKPKTVRASALLPVLDGKRLTTTTMHVPAQQRERLLQDHRVKNFVAKINAMSSGLLEKYNDPDGSRAEETAAMKGDEVFKNFYERLTSIRDYHARFPNTGMAKADPAVRFSLPGCVCLARRVVVRSWWRIPDVWLPRQTLAVQAAEPVLTFSGEECVGRFLDLQVFHERYCNFPGVRLDYQSYLDKVGDLASVPRRNKNMDYTKYVEDLAAYLQGFFERTSPLVDLDPLLARLRARFEKEWKAGTLPGWGGDDDSGASTEDHFCAPCNRRFTKATVFQAHMNSKKHKRVVARQAAAGDSGNGHGDAGGGATESLQARCAWAEMRVARLLELLSDIVDATKRQTEKKQTRTFQELEAEIEAAEAGEGDSDLEDSDDEEQVLYNPKNLPLGWDGKPIPYWLYKLHGLNMKFKCEICGNHTYAGRRDFDRHFREWRHAQGMRALGIPNTKHFHDITEIDDAVNRT